MIHMLELSGSSRFSIAEAWLGEFWALLWTWSSSSRPSGFYEVFISCKSWRLIWLISSPRELPSFVVLCGWFASLLPFLSLLTGNQHPLQKAFHLLLDNCVPALHRSLCQNHPPAVVAERLRQWSRNPLGSPPAGSNPANYGKSRFRHTCLVLFCRRLHRPFKEFMNGWDMTGTPRGLDDEDMTELGSRAIVVTTWVREERETHKTLQTIANRKASSAETDNADCTGHLIQTLPISFLLLLYKFIYFGLCQLWVVTRRIFHCSTQNSLQL